MSFDVIAYLAGKGLRGRQASGGREMTYACFFDCAEPADSKKKKLYVNVEEGVYSCLTGDTVVLTREGLRPIAELAGGVHEIVTSGGRWVKAPFHHFGRQPVRTVTVRRNKVTKTIRATPEHRWIYETSTRTGRSRHWATTDELVHGMLLAAELPELTQSDLDADGVRHGIVFGDGTRGSRAGSSVVLYLPKAELASLFEAAYATDCGTRVGRLPRHYKDLPGLSMSPGYLAGWLAGYIATDGTVDGSGNISIDSVSTSALQRVREVAALLGIGVGPIGSHKHSGGSLAAGEHMMHKVTLYGAQEWLLLRELHRKRAKLKGGGPGRLRWRVLSVGELEPEEDVYCAVVPETESFVLDDFILTGNCKVCGASGGPFTLQRHFGDDPKAGTTDDAFTRRQILDWAVTVGAQMLGNRDDVLLYLLNERGLGPDTITERKLGFVGDGWSLTGSLPERFGRDQLLHTGLVWKDGPRKGNDYFYRHLLIPVTHRGHVVQIRGRIWGEARGGKYMSGPGEPVRAFNIDSLDGAVEAVLTEGEFDAIRLHEVLRASTEDRIRRIAVVGLPGTSAYPDELDDYLTELKRIYIGLDSDEPGRLAAEKLREKYGARARVLALPNVDGRKCDWTEYLLPIQSRRGFDIQHPYAGHDAADVMRLMSAAAGKRIYSVAEAGEAFRQYRASNTGLQTGWHQLDATIAPGLLPGQVVFILAKTGCLAGDTEVVVNRGGKGFRTTMKTLYQRFNGFDGRWDLAIPTYIQRELDGVVRLVKVKEVWASGQQQTYTLTTSSGRSIRATAMHPFLTDDGWRQLDELSVGDQVHVNVGRSWRGRGPKPVYQRRTVKAHPYAGRRAVRNGGWSVPLHRLVVEAAMNVMTTEDFIAHLRDPEVDITGLRFFDPDVWAVHHIDHNPLNNELPNLKVLTHSEHHALHAAEGKDRHVLEQIGSERVVAIEPFGMEETYDLEVQDAPHRYLANGFTVHNTGKTLILCNLAYQMRKHRILFISLEMTREEVYHRLQRIYWHHHPTASTDELEYALANVWICDENRLGERDLQALVNEYGMENGANPDVIFVDYLGYYARGARGSSPYEKVSNAAMQLKADAKAGRLVVISPTQVNRVAKDGKTIDLDDARDSGAIEETGDFVLAAYRPDAALSEGIVNVSPTYKVMLSVLKSRHGGVSKTITLQMDALTLAIVEDGTRAAKIAEEHNILLRRGKTWDELRADQTRPRQLAMPDGAS